MDKTDKIALVPRTPGALEKRKPVEKHILANMVADTLALVKTDEGAIPAQSAISIPFRIVLVDDEKCITELIREIIVTKFGNVLVKSFLDSQKAWLELSQTSPDLLIFGGIMPRLTGHDIVSRLVDKRVSYPIIVVSGYPPVEKWVQEYTSKNSQISYLRKPFTSNQLCELISKQNPQLVRRSKMDRTNRE